MLDKLQHTFKHTLIYSLGNISIKIVGFILLPFYTAKLTTSQYGILAILETTFNITAAIFLLNINAAVTRFYSDAKQNNYVGKLLFTALCFVLASGIAVNLIFQPLAKQLSLLIFQTTEFTIYFNLLFINVALQNITYIIRGYFNAQEKSVKFSLLNFSRFLVVLVLTIYFIVKLNWGIKGILLAQTISYIFAIIIFFPSYLKDVQPKFDKRLLSLMLKYSYPLAFSLISSMVLSFGDRYVLKFLMDEAAVGIYSLASKLANVLDFLILQGFQLAYIPYAFKIYKSEGFRYFHGKMTTYIVLSMLFLGLGMALFSKGIIMIFSPTNKNYWLAATYVPYLAFMRSLFGLRFMFAISLHITKKTRSIPLIVISAATLNILLNLIFIPKFQIYGAIISSFISVVFMDIIYYITAQKFFPLRYEFKRIFIAYIFALGIFALSSLVKHHNMYIVILLKAILFALYPISLYLIGFFEPQEIDSFKGFIKKWYNPKNWKTNLSNLKNS